jgi:hypothetical protein
MLLNPPHSRRAKVTRSRVSTHIEAENGLVANPYFTPSHSIGEGASLDLKAREFTPEAAGKMNFYLSAVDDQFRQPTDQPSMGLILCRSKNRIIAEYALRDLTKPIGVSGYVTKLVESLPKALKGAVPSVAELEKELTTKTK